jgi:F-type H+-transporting ATPase subunit a
VEQTPKKKWWRWGVNRWLVLFLIIGSFLTAVTWGIKPIQPHVQLPAEKLSCTPIIALPAPWGDLPAPHCSHGADDGHAEEPVTGIYLTNTIVAMLVADALLLLMGFAFWRYSRSGSLVPKGFSGALEALLEALYNLTEGTAGKWAKTIFPWFATITLLVLVANWTELIPGVDSIGWIEEAAHGGYEVERTALGINTIVKGDEDAHIEHGYHVVPFVRVVSTDLNFTVALALIAVFMVQVIGVRALGLGYFTKFWSTKTLFSKPIFGVIDFAVGILELVADIAKILSFAFRLFGNIFAGSVLLFVIGSLVPVFAQSGFLMLEFFVGLIQAIVFGLLTMTFMAQATHGHGDHEEAHA